jgi:hypothetical protein
MNKIKINKQLVTTIGITTLLIACPSVRAFAVERGIDPNDLGMKFWSIIKIIAKWGCLIMCGIKLIQNLGVEDAKGLGKIVFKYAFVYTLIVLLPRLYNQIDLF